MFYYNKAVAWCKETGAVSADGVPDEVAVRAFSAGARAKAKADSDCLASHLQFPPHTVVCLVEIMRERLLDESLDR